ncbi:beta-glucosidase, putative [Talaromyces stipitatus ATCC 10500]|uniref:Beta-glucosidase, putative n=1 Tax=Talaromyces stipitatus (strain ATCC 10500 / CBS 375.48 / QM 6759 / NRRL 1006) TaxID=441959 RepID=B8MM30_TALSN|nr:beta-glucosidase, putative [Talaromyces stipitatus ATCC 10500]EED13542.1 beta-glucosidase, putative [Talaromyces stipitatus ATCC 10500]
MARSSIRRNSRLILNALQGFASPVSVIVSRNGLHFEPYIISIFGNHSGVLAPGRSTPTGGDSRTERWQVGHTIILSHAAVVQIYTTEFQQSQTGEISIVLNGQFYEPWDLNSDMHIEAAQRRLEFYIGWFGDPIFLGQDCPESMKSRLGDRLPRFTTEELELLCKNWAGIWNALASGCACWFPQAVELGLETLPRAYRYN